MSAQKYIYWSHVFFLIVFMMHSFRLFYGWNVFLNDLPIPFWVSWIALGITGYFVYHGKRLLQ